MKPLPRHRILTFQQNEVRRDIYDLVSENFRTFSFIRLSEPRNINYYRQGADWILESWKKGEKSVFTGLLPIGCDYYVGNRLRESGRKNLMVVSLNNDGVIRIAYFPGCPNGKHKQKQYAIDFVKRLSVHLKKHTTTCQ